jgi:hypothetical protein
MTTPDFPPAFYATIRRIDPFTHALSLRVPLAMLRAAGEFERRDQVGIRE